MYSYVYTYEQEYMQQTARIWRNFFVGHKRATCQKFILRHAENRYKTIDMSKIDIDMSMFVGVCVDMSMFVYVCVRKQILKKRHVDIATCQKLMYIDMSQIDIATSNAIYQLKKKKLNPKP